jgi:hypothetical protein
VAAIEARREFGKLLYLTHRVELNTCQLIGTQEMLLRTGRMLPRTWKEEAQRIKLTLTKELTCTICALSPSWYKFI